MKIYIDGVYCSESEAKISVFDHGLLYGDGVFEGIRFLWRWRLQIERNILSVFLTLPGRSTLNIGMTVEEMIDATLATIRENELQDGYIRLLVTRGVGGSGIESLFVQESFRDHHRLQDSALSRGEIHRWIEDDDLCHAASGAGGAESGGEISELLEQCHGQGGGTARWIR